MDQKLVIAHVYGHCDFFKNNAWFAHTNRRMLDEMANHATRVSRHIDRYGYETVEKFIDACLSLEDLIDPHSRHIVREAPAKRSPVEEPNPDDERDATEPTRFRSKAYMDAFINPPEVLEAEHRRLERERKDKLERRSFPEQPQRDVLRFLLEHAPLQPWQRDILAIVRDEAYYFAPQGQTKIMNEGWASYWHSKIMTRHGLTDAELIDYADHHSGTMATSPGRLNPYKLGIELFKDIEDRWNKGKFGPEYDACTDTRERARWNTGLGAGRQKIFEVRRVHNDVTFIDAFLTPEFCVEQKLFRFQHNDTTIR
jgi:stage V sporulation protein R